MDALEFIGVVVEPDAAWREIQIVIDTRATGKETSGTNAEIVQAVVDDRIVEIGNGCTREILADGDCITTGHEEEFVGLESALAHGIELARSGSRVSKFQIVENGFDR